MKRLMILALGLTLAVTTLPALAHDDHKMASMKTTTPRTITGEVVDTGCYLAHEARGEKHIQCATKCISGGMPMGLLTADGKLYLLTLNHDNADPYNKLKDMAGKTVSVTGMVMERAGMKGIDVTDFKTVAVQAGK